MRILVFGDSIAWGAFDTEKGGWVDRLKLYIMKPGVYDEVFNFCDPGSTSEMIPNYIEQICSTVVRKKKKQNAIILAVGVNDTQVSRATLKTRISLEQFNKNVEGMIRLAKEFVDTVVLIGLIPVNEKKTSSWLYEVDYRLEVIAQYNKTLKSLAEKHKSHFISLNTVKPSMLYDGLHPNTKGHQKIFEIVKTYLEKNKLI